jgi:hypothetical protein
MKNLLQQRHFRRVTSRLIVRPSPPPRASEENQKEDAEEKPTEEGRRVLG